MPLALQQQPTAAPGAFRRQDPRFEVTLLAELLSTRPPRPAVVGDVSFRGLFLQTPTPVSLRGLVRFSVRLPGADRELVLHGMVVNVVGPRDPEGRPPGMGIELFALDPEARRAWWELVHYAREHGDDLDDRSGVRERAP